MEQVLSTRKNLINEQRQIKRSFHPVNSSVLIRQLQQLSKQNERKKMLHKKQLQKEIKKTNYNIKIKKLHKSIKLQKFLQNQNIFTYQNTQIPNYQNNQEKNFSSTIGPLLFKKRNKNSSLKLKMRLFGNSITDRKKAGIQQQINNQVTRIEQRKTVNNADFHQYMDENERILSKQQDNTQQKNENNPQGQIKLQNKNEKKQWQKIQKMKKFTICHMILDKLLGLMVHNPHYISLKYQNPQIYKNIKEQMLQILINNQKIKQSIRILQNQMKTSDPSKFNFSKLKFKKMQKQRSPFYLFQQKKKDQLSDQIITIMQSLKQMIDQALFNFNKPDVAYNLQQHWQHRQGNILSNQKQHKNWSKTQSLLRSTTINRLKCP